MNDTRNPRTNATVWRRPSRTKIVATLGPASDSPDMIERLIEAGVDVFRLNMAHGAPPVLEKLLHVIREISARLHRPVAVLADLAGPKIRLGELPDGHFQCDANETVRFVRGVATTTPGDLTTSYAPLVDELDVGDRVMLADGTVALRVEMKDAAAAVCRVTQSGLVRSRQGVNLPGVKLRIPTLQPVDREHAEWAADVGVDFLGVSFVRTPEDVLELQRIVANRGGHAQVIAKIEKPEALENLEAIVQAADGLMVARGDLGVETDIAAIAVVQKRIIHACRRHGKPVITATQMLDSMQHESMPTRAEATDVANAILDGTDACMLSGETAIGRYPIEAVEMMHRIALATESMRGAAAAGEEDRDRYGDVEPPEDPVTSATAHAAGDLAERLGAAVVMVVSRTGAAALLLSKQRRRVDTIGISPSDGDLRRMALYWGVIPVSNVSSHSLDVAYAELLERGRDLGFLHDGDRVVVLSGSDLAVDRHNAVHVHVV